MGRTRRSVRFDERTWMLLKELSEKTGAKISVIIRGMVSRSIESLLDTEGNFKLNEKKAEEEQD